MQGSLWVPGGHSIPGETGQVNEHWSGAYDRKVKADLVNLGGNNTDNTALEQNQRYGEGALSGFSQRKLVRARGSSFKLNQLIN